MQYVYIRRAPRLGIALAVGLLVANTLAGCAAAAPEFQQSSGNQAPPDQTVSDQAPLTPDQVQPADQTVPGQTQIVTVPASSASKKAQSATSKQSAAAKGR